jgi:ribosome-associated translation inhibitor RaiA
VKEGEHVINKFHFKNFEPEFQTRVVAEDTLQRLEQETPTSSTIVGLLESLGTEYCASIDVYFMGGTFLAIANASDPEQAIKLVAEKILSKIQNWKQSNRRSSPPAVVIGDKSRTRAIA